MVVVKIGSRGVVGVSFESSGDVLDDAAVQLWPIIQRELARLDRTVKRSNARVLRAVFGTR